MVTNKNHYNSPSTYKSKDNSNLIAESLKAIFINKKMGLYTHNAHITGTCCDVKGGVICLTDAKLILWSSLSKHPIVEKEVSFLMVEKQGKTLTLEE